MPPWLPVTLCKPVICECSDLLAHLDCLGLVARPSQRSHQNKGSSNDYWKAAGTVQPRCNPEPVTRWMRVRFGINWLGAALRHQRGLRRTIL